jgi:hypothetical protein
MAKLRCEMQMLFGSSGVCKVVKLHKFKEYSHDWQAGNFLVSVLGWSLKWSWHIPKPEPPYLVSIRKIICTNFLMAVVHVRGKKHCQDYSFKYFAYAPLFVFLLYSVTPLPLYTPRGKSPPTHWLGGWMDPRDTLGLVPKRKNPFLDPGGNWTPVIQPIA